MLTLADIPVAVLCGGKGTRLGRLTKHTPKILIKVAGKPFLHWQMELLASQGARKVIFFVGPHGRAIGRAIDWHWPWPMQPLVFEEPRLGTGGAIADALEHDTWREHLGDEFATLYGDSYLPYPWQPILDSWAKTPQLHKGAQVTLWRHHDWGLNLFHVRAFEGLPQTHCGLQRVFLREWQAGRLGFHHINRPFLEMGSIAGLKHLEAYLVAQHRLSGEINVCPPTGRQPSARAHGRSSSRTAR